MTKLYATAESQLQSYVAALAERKRKAALLSDGKKMENGHPCVNFMFANNDGTMFCKKRSLTLGWATLKLMRMMTWSRSKMTHRSRTTRRSMLGCVVFSVTSNNLNGRFASYLHTPAYRPRQATPHPRPLAATALVGSH